MQASGSSTIDLSYRHDYLCYVDSVVRAAPLFCFFVLTYPTDLSAAEGTQSEEGSATQRQKTDHCKRPTDRQADRRTSPLRIHQASFFSSLECALPACRRATLCSCQKPKPINQYPTRAGQHGGKRWRLELFLEVFRLSSCFSFLVACGSLLIDPSLVSRRLKPESRGVYRTAMVPEVRRAGLRCASVLAPLLKHSARFHLY